MTIPQNILDKILKNEFIATIENWVYTIKEPIPTFQPAENAFVPFCIRGQLDGKEIETSKILHINFEDKWVYTKSGSLYRLGEKYQFE